jgi:hypothetical protein
MLLFIITAIFLLGAIGEENNEWRNKYFFGTLVTTIVLVMSVKCL